MADLPETAPRHSPELGWCPALYARLSRRERRRMAALMVWETASEMDALGFQVLRAADAIWSVDPPWAPR